MFGPSIHQASVAACDRADEDPHDRIISAWNGISLQVSLAANESKSSMENCVTLLSFISRNAIEEESGDHQ